MTWRRSILLAALASMVAGCGVDETGVAPPTDELWFPLGVAAHPDGRYVYLTNAIFDRKFNAGTVVVFDTVDAKILPEATVQIGLFAGEIALGRPLPPADCMPGDGGARCNPATTLYTTTRDNDKLIELGIDQAAGDGPGHLKCNQRGTVCAGASVHGDFAGDGVFSPSPYGMALDGRGLFLTHVERGEISRWDQVGDSLNYLCSINLTEGATAIARHPATGQVYASDRFGQRISVVSRTAPFGQTVEGVAGDPCDLRNDGSIPLDPSPDRGRSRGLAFSADGSLLFVASSSDSTVRVYNTAVGRRGPQNRLLTTISMGGTPNLIRIAGLQAGEVRVEDGLDRGSVGAAVDAAGEGLVYVTLLEDDRVLVIDPVTLTVIARIEVPGGPHDLTFLPDAMGQLRAYVTLFKGHALGILDVQPGSSERFTLVATVP